MNLDGKARFAAAGLIVAVALALEFGFGHSISALWRTPQPPLKLTFGMSWTPGNANAFIAKQQGFFREAGLELNLQRYTSSRLTLADLLKDKLDVAIVSETPVALAALRGERFYILATTYESPEVTVLIARRDRGITTPADLAGKRIATVFGTNGEFVLDTILALNGIDPGSIARVNLSQEKSGDALLAGELDAATSRPPRSQKLQARLGEAAVVFSADAVHTTSYQLLARAAVVNAHPEALRGLLAALLRAHAYVRADPARAARTVARASGLDEALVAKGMDPVSLTVLLGQSLITALDTRARWAIARHMVNTTEVPDFYAWIRADALAAVRAEAVSLIR